MRRRVTFQVTILFTLFTLAGHAQNPEFDSLQNFRQLLFADPVVAEEKLLNLSKLASERNDFDLLAASESSRARGLNLRGYTDSAHNIIRRYLDNPQSKSAIVRALLNQDHATVLMIKRQYDSALVYIDSTLSFSKSFSDPKWRHQALLDKVEVLENLQRADMAISILTAMFKEIENDEELIAEINATSSIINIKSFNTEFGISLGLKELPFLESNKYLKARLLHTLGYGYLETNLDSAENLLQESLALCKSAEFLWIRKKNLNTLSQLEGMKGDLDKAQNYIETSWNVHPANTYNYAEASDWYRTGLIAYQQGDYLTALVCAESGYKTVETTKAHQDQFNFSNIIYNTYRKMDLADSALKYVELNRMHFDQVMTQEQIRALDEYEDMIGNLEKQNTILRLENENFMERNRRNLLTVAVVFLLVIGLSLVIYFRNRSHMYNLLIQSRESEIQHQTLHMIDLNNKMTEVESEAKELRKKGEVTYKDIQRIINKIQATRNMEKDWEKFDQYFGNRHKDFYEKLEEIHPGLPVSSKRLAALVRMQLTNDEISGILNVTSKSARMGKYRLKQKLGLGEDDDLYAYLKSI